MGGGGSYDSNMWPQLGGKERGCGRDRGEGKEVGLRPVGRAGGCCATFCELEAMAGYFGNLKYRE